MSRTSVIKLSDLIDDFITENGLPYCFTYTSGMYGIREMSGSIWLAWIYDDQACVKSWWGDEIICLNASDPDFFPMFEFWLAFNNEMMRD